jgi:septal ring factor EnvC (AmiA/AmiB activator)
MKYEEELALKISDARLKLISMSDQDTNQVNLNDALNVISNLKCQILAKDKCISAITKDAFNLDDKKNAELQSLRDELAAKEKEADRLKELYQFFSEQLQAKEKENEELKAKLKI